MTGMSNFWQKQSQYLLQNDRYAWLLVAALAFIPFAAWTSLAIISLLTLRKSSYSGFMALIICLLVVGFCSQQALSLPYNNAAMIVTFIIGYMAAVVLRYTRNLNATITITVMVALLGMVFVHCLIPEYVNEQYKSLVLMFSAIEKEGTLAQVLNGQLGTNADLLANYFLGVKSLCVVFSALSSLMLARSIQSRLFYPGGFKKEILGFRASQISVLLLVFSAIGAYQNNYVAISCLPLLVIYLMTAGMILFFNIMKNKKNTIAIFLLLVPLILIPYIMLPIYVCLGSLDSMFDFRLRLLANSR